MGFRSFRSPQGRFTVSIPAGWEYKAFAPDESSIGFTPQGKPHPEISIAFTEASIAAAQTGTQLAGRPWYAQQLSAEEFLREIFIPLLRQKVSDLTVDSLVSKETRAAELIVSGGSGANKVQAKIICTMDYLQDPTIPPAGGWYNFAYLNSVVAPPSQIAAAEPLAAQIFRSFRPTERWLAEVTDAIVQGMAARRQMIARTVKRINAMEMQQRMAEMQSATKIGKGWMDALGGTVELKDPTSGDTWRVWDQHKYYYEEGNRVFGTDDPAELNLPGRQPLER